MRNTHRADLVPCGDEEIPSNRLLLRHPAIRGRTGVPESDAFLTFHPIMLSGVKSRTDRQ